VAKIPVGEVAVPKAGVFAEDAAQWVVENILVKEGFEQSAKKYEAIGACYFEFGEGRVAKVNVNFWVRKGQGFFSKACPPIYVKTKKSFKEPERRGGLSKSTTISVHPSSNNKMQAYGSLCTM